MTAPAVAPASHEHQWQVVFVDYDSGQASQELSCSCGEVSFSSL